MAANPVTTPELKLITEKKRTIEDKLAELHDKRAAIKQGGGKQRIEKQHAAGKLTARERVEELVDLFAKHRATYFGMADKELPADGVVTGCALDTSCQPGLHRRRRCSR